MTAETQAQPHNVRYGPSPGRAAYNAGCRCLGCKAANAQYAREQRAKNARARPASGNGARPDPDPFGWQREPESGAEPEPAGHCPECQAPMRATVGGTSAACPACGYWQRSADAIARLDATRPKRGQVAERGPSRAELDRAALDLAGRKGKMRSQVIAFREKESKRLAPDSLEQIELILSWINTAEDNERLDQIIALMRGHKWNRQHWYNLPPKPEIASGEYYVADNAEETGLCEVYLPGEDYCENEIEDDSHIIIDPDDSNVGYRVCPDHYDALPEHHIPEPEPEPEPARPGQSYVGALTQLMGKPTFLTTDQAGYKTGVVIPSKPARPQSANTAATMIGMSDWLHQNVNGWKINPNGNDQLCPVIDRITGQPCTMNYSQQVSEPGITDGMVWLCANHANEATSVIRRALKLRNVPWNTMWGRLGHNVDYRRAQLGHCCLADMRHVSNSAYGNTIEWDWCQRSGVMALGNAGVCRYHYNAVVNTLQQMGSV